MMTNLEKQTLDKAALFKLTLIYSLLLISWFMGETRSIWNMVDISFFKTLNTTLGWNPYWAIFWAYMNADFLDRAMEVLIFGLTFWGIWRLPLGLKKNLGSFLKYYLAFTLTFIVIKWLIHKGLYIKRSSPTFVLEETIRLKDLIPYKLKDASRNSFPADHALFLFLMYQYARRRLDPTIQKVILSIVVIFTLPRLISGGHWLTDAFFGGWVPSALFAQVWLGKVNTPISSKPLDAPEE